MQKVVKSSNRQIAKSPNRQNTLNRPLAETSALATAQRIKRAPLKSLLFLPFLFCFAALSGPRRAQRASMEFVVESCSNNTHFGGSEVAAASQSEQILAWRP